MANYTSLEQAVYAALTDAYWSRLYSMPMALDACKALEAEPTTERLDALCQIIDRNLVEPNFTRMAREVAEEIGQ